MPDHAGQLREAHESVHRCRIQRRSCGCADRGDGSLVVPFSMRADVAAAAAAAAAAAILVTAAAAAAALPFVAAAAAAAVALPEPPAA
jgi:hypothetical protein